MASGDADGRRFRTRTLDDEESRAVLDRNWWGTLAVGGDDGPYAVPVIYGWDGARFHFISGSGEKVRRLKTRPLASLTVVEVLDDGGDWWSVQARGPVEFLGAEADLRHAVRTLRSQRGKPAEEPGEAILARVSRAEVFRLVPRTITGRTKA